MKMHVSDGSLHAFFKSLTCWCLMKDDQCVRSDCDVKRPRVAGSDQGLLFLTLSGQTSPKVSSIAGLIWEHSPINDRG